VFLIVRNGSPSVTRCDTRSKGKTKSESKVCTSPLIDGIVATEPESATAAQDKSPIFSHWTPVEHERKYKRKCLMLKICDLYKWPLSKRDASICGGCHHGPVFALLRTPTPMSGSRSLRAPRLRGQAAGSQLQRLAYTPPLSVINKICSQLLARRDLSLT
jgi:hypothetical protein